MSKGKSSLLPRMEVLIILVFFICFIIWAMSKCSATKEKYKEEAALVEQSEDYLTARDSALLDTIPPEPQPEPIEVEKYSRLYVCIDGLNMRDKPSLKGKLIDRLKLFDEVFFLNEVTDSTQEISLGKIVANEPWIKVKTRKGREGWVYGAGINFYKKEIVVE